MEELKQPGEEGFIRPPLPDRDYDLSPLDRSKPSIHVLVDDVMIRILEHLPVKERILCEIVCRRWQAILYGMFKRTQRLDLSQFNPIKTGRFPQFQCRVSMSAVSKMLILTGETLKYLSLARDGYVPLWVQPIVKYDSTGEKLFLIIAQLCPNLEYLDLSGASELDFDDVKALKDCKHIKHFSAKGCDGLNNDSFQELISALPHLEKINVMSTAIEGRCFNILPAELKELNISDCPLSMRNLRKLSNTCKTLEVLEIEGLRKLDEEFFKQLGVNCKSLTTLNINNGKYAELVHGVQETIEHIVKDFPDLKHFKCNITDPD
ncbi:unnamed protein product [Meganyctiphanes norvegica]|uniref:F-box domain-containing protein n=1 Tax=Meganyctiphanes norvegica TaxID=48144 RepID=A0AAV2R0F1_MEGNR